MPTNTISISAPNSAVPATSKRKPRSKPKLFTDKELQALGAAVWAALEEDTDTLHHRFFPGESHSPITKAQLLDKLCSVRKKLEKLGVDMG